MPTTRKHAKQKIDKFLDVKIKTKVIVFDIETNGLDKEHSVLSCSAIKYEINPEIYEMTELNRFDRYYFPVEQLNPSAIDVNGLTRDVITERRGNANYPQHFNQDVDLEKFCNGVLGFVAHNISFDTRFIPFLEDKKRFCTMMTNMDIVAVEFLKWKNEWKYPKLSETAIHYGVPFNQSDLHSSMYDTEITAKIFLKMIYAIRSAEVKMFDNTKKDTTKQNQENLHNIVENIEVTNSGFYRYEAEIKHLGLGTFRVLKDMEKDRLDNKIEAQFKKWDEQWERISHKKKSQTDKEASLKIAEERTRDAQEKLKQIDDLLIYTIDIDDTVTWDSLKDMSKFEVPNQKNNLGTKLSKTLTSPTFRELPIEPNIGLYKPKLSLVDNIFKSLKDEKIKKAEKLYQGAMTAWEKSVGEINNFNYDIKVKYEQKLKEYEEKKQALCNRYDTLEEDWEKEKELYYKNQKEYNDKIDKLKESYFNRSADAVIQYCEIVLNNSKYPETFPKDFDLDYNPDGRILIIEYFLPTPDDLPSLTEVKYISTKKEFKESFLLEKQVSKNYDSAIYKITLRTLHELFEADKVEALETVIFNGWVKSINKATGNKINNCVVTIQAKKAEFIQIELSNVDPKICFQNLKGIGSNKLSSITAVQPIAQTNKNDKRFIPSNEVENQLIDVKKNGT